MAEVKGDVFGVRVDRVAYVDMGLVNDHSLALPQSSDMMLTGLGNPQANLVIAGANLMYEHHLYRFRQRGVMSVPPAEAATMVKDANGKLLNCSIRNSGQVAGNVLRYCQQKNGIPMYIVEPSDGFFRRVDDFRLVGEGTTFDRVFISSRPDVGALKEIMVSVEPDSPVPLNFLMLSVRGFRRVREALRDLGLTDLAVVHDSGVLYRAEMEKAILNLMNSANNNRAAAR